jgi:16S rRNA (guanine1516-N2)-methyltransferase
VSIDLYFTDARRDHALSFKPWCALHSAQIPPKISAGYALWLDQQGLSLLSADNDKQPPFRLTQQMFDARRRGKSLLAQACGVKRGRAGTTRVLDAFAGFGLDALTLADLGCQVWAIEKQRLVWLMLDHFVDELGLPVHTQCADALEVMSASAQDWDIVYLDPMFAARRKSALPNLGLQHLQAISGDQQVDLDACVALALAKATQRVVLKRRRKDAVIGKPSFQLPGQAVRFDVYLKLLR